MIEIQTIRAAINGNREAFNCLYLDYKHLWYSICLRYQSNTEDAADVLQNGLIKLYTHLKQFEPTKGDFKSWSCKLMVNENLMFIRTQLNSKNRMPEELLLGIADTREQPIDSLSAKELTLMVQSLPLGYRTVFNLYVIEGYSHSEIASLLNIAEGSSKSQLSKAKKMLRQILEQQLNVFKYED